MNAVALFPADHDGPCANRHLCRDAVAHINGAFYITFGHAGFNGPRNNGVGYSTETKAREAIQRFGAKAMLATYRGVRMSRQRQPRFVVICLTTASVKRDAATGRSRLTLKGSQGDVRLLCDPVALVQMLEGVGEDGVLTVTFTLQPQDVHVQARVPKGRRVWGARGQFSERDADAYAIRTLRAWRRREVAS